MVLSLIKSRTTYDSMYQLLNADTEEERDQLTERWKDNKLEELNFVGIVGALLANVLTSTNSWPDILQDGQRTPWTVRACWFIGIIFSIVSVLTAASQSIRLHRLSCRKHGLKAIRHLLSSRSHRPNSNGRTSDVVPGRSQVLIWQLSVAWLMCSAVTMVVGIFILLWAATGGDNWWNGQAQLAVTFTIVATIVIAIFAWEQSVLFSLEEVGNAVEDEGRLRL